MRKKRESQLCKNAKLTVNFHYCGKMWQGKIRIIHILVHILLILTVPKSWSVIRENIEISLTVITQIQMRKILFFRELKPSWLKLVLYIYNLWFISTCLCYIFFAFHTLFLHHYDCMDFNYEILSFKTWYYNSL